MILYGRLDERDTPLPLLTLIAGGLVIEGFVFADYVAEPANRAALIRFTLAALADGSLDPVIDLTFPLDAIAAANTRLESGEQMGKIVVQVAA